MRAARPECALTLYPHIAIFLAVDQDAIRRLRRGECHSPHSHQASVLSVNRHGTTRHLDRSGEISAHGVNRCDTTTHNGQGRDLSASLRYRSVSVEMTWGCVLALR